MSQAHQPPFVMHRSTLLRAALTITYLCCLHAQWNESAYEQRLSAGQTGCQTFQTLKVIYCGAAGSPELDLATVVAETQFPDLYGL